MSLLKTNVLLVLIRFLLEKLSVCFCSGFPVATKTPPKLCQALKCDISYLLVLSRILKKLSEFRLQDCFWPTIVFHYKKKFAGEARFNV